MCKLASPCLFSGGDLRWTITTYAGGGVVLMNCCLIEKPPDRGVPIGHGPNDLCSVRLIRKTWKAFSDATCPFFSYLIAWLDGWKSEWITWSDGAAVRIGKSLKHHLGCSPSFGSAPPSTRGPKARQIWSAIGNCDGNGAVVKPNIYCCLLSGVAWERM